MHVQHADLYISLMGRIHSRCTNASALCRAPITEYVGSWLHWSLTPVCAYLGLSDRLAMACEQPIQATCVLQRKVGHQRQNIRMLRV